MKIIRRSSGAILTVVLVSVQVSAATARYTCEGRTHSRPMYWQTLECEINEQGIPQNLTITKTMTKRVENTCPLGKPLPLEPGDPLARDFVRYDVTGATKSGNHYYLSLPKAALGTAPFQAVLETEFGGGDHGHWRTRLNCSKR
jgi:hypothetical protein